ncbi:hypothetical protein VTI74DRAFT_7267 [Chaetomium olivicolor]
MAVNAEDGVHRASVCSTDSFNHLRSVKALIMRSPNIGQSPGTWAQNAMGLLAIPMKLDPNAQRHNQTNGLASSEPLSSHHPCLVIRPSRPMMLLGSSKSHKHGSGHGSRRDTAKHSKAAKAKSPGATSQGAQGSFLFIVNELQVDPDSYPEVDQWLNPVPPERADAYVGEVVGTVFRYQNGIVSPAHGYRWYRDPTRADQTGIYRFNQQTGRFDGRPAHYRTQTIFACSALLPMIVTDGDPSLGNTFLRRLCNCDARYDREGYSPWFPLHFAGGDQGGGISYVCSGATGDPWVAGKDASWIPALVPSAYRNTAPSAPRSRGLSGHLPIILALMAFHGRRDRASEVFLNRSWHMNRWSGSSRASAYLPKSGESPRGLLVQVCADNLVEGLEDNAQNNIPREEYEDMLLELEGAILVEDNP